MHRSLKTVLSALCQGHPLQRPQYLAACQVVLNRAIHTSTGSQPYFAFFSHHAPRNIGTSLPSVNGEEDKVAVAHKVIRDTHLRMSQKY